MMWFPELQTAIARLQLNCTAAILFCNSSTSYWIVL